MIRELIIGIFQTFDQHLQQQADDERRDGGTTFLRKRDYRIVGQVALLLADLPFDIAATTDIDVLHQASYPELKILAELCLNAGLILETDQHLIWMPAKTVFRPFFDGVYVNASFADPFYVAASKCKFQRDRDRPFLMTYFQKFPDAEKKIHKMGIETTWVR